MSTLTSPDYTNSDFSGANISGTKFKSTVTIANVKGIGMIDSGEHTLYTGVKQTTIMLSGYQLYTDKYNAKHLFANGFNSSVDYSRSNASEGITFEGVDFNNCIMGSSKLDYVTFEGCIFNGTN